MGTTISHHEYTPINSSNKTEHLINFASLGNLAMLEYFSTNEQETWIQNRQKVANICATHGYLECLQFTLESGAYVDRELFAHVVKCPNSACLKYLLDGRCLDLLFDSDIMYCAEYGLVNNLKCLHEFGIILEMDHLRAAHLYSHDKCIEFIESVCNYN